MKIEVTFCAEADTTSEDGEFCPRANPVALLNTITGWKLGDKVTVVFTRENRTQSVGGDYDGSGSRTLTFMTVTAEGAPESFIHVLAKLFPEDSAANK